ncbi:MAG: DUF3810 family protein [Saprospiraceae bacterium]
MDKTSKTYIFYKKLHSRSLVWIGLALITILLSDILPSSFVDRWYYQSLFSWIRVLYDTLLGWLPFPMLYIVVAIILVRVFLWIRSRKRGLLHLITKALGGVAFLVFVFYFGWGFNYNQISLQKRLGFNLKDVTQPDIEVEYQRATLELQKAAEELPAQLKTDESISALKISDDDLRPDVEKALSELGIPDRGRVRVRQVWPPGLLLRWSTAGIYIPQAFEGHIDKGLLSVQKPYTIAHEMAHGYGVTDEGACNFIAWLACRESNNPWVRFGGAFTYWRYAASEMPGDSVAQELKTIPPVVLRSLSLIRKNDEKYPDLLPKIRDAIYSNYLKHHGVEGGLRSYNYVVMMVVEYLGKKEEGK